MKAFLGMDPIDNLYPSNLLGLGSVTSDRGCPPSGSCTGGCVPFCCANGQAVSLVVKKISVPQVITTTAKQIITSLSAPLAAGAALSTLSDMFNKSAIAAGHAAYAKAKLDFAVKSIVNQISAFLQCHLPWCDCISNIQKSAYFAANSETFGSDGPARCQDALNIYVSAANTINNARFGKTKQKIIQVMGNKSDANIDEIGLPVGWLLVKVPNIEHYWMHDTVLLPGISTPMRVEHRWGLSKIMTNDCYRVFVDQRIYPAGNHDHGRGCSLSYNANTSSGTTTGQGANSGLNVRNMEGEGWLYFNLPYNASHQAMTGQWVDLSNPIYIDPNGQVTTTTPPPVNTLLPGTIPGTTTTTTTPLPGVITPIKPATTASFTTIVPVVILLGIGATFIFQAIKNQQ